MNFFRIQKEKNSWPLEAIKIILFEVFVLWISFQTFAPLMTFLNGKATGCLKDISTIAFSLKPEHKKIKRSKGFS